MGKLSKDLKDFDIMGEDSSGDNGSTDIMGDSSVETNTGEEGDLGFLDGLGGDENETVDNQEEQSSEPSESVSETNDTEKTSEVSEGTEESQEEIDLDELFAGMDDVVDQAKEDTTDMKNNIEGVQEAINSGNNEEAIKLAEDLYTQILQYESDLEEASTRYEVLKGKFNEKSKQLEETNLANEEKATMVMSEDPSMKVLNRMYDDAVKGKDTAKAKVTGLLEDMYYKITGNSFEEKAVDSSVNKQSENTTYGDTTMPNETVAPVEEEDIYSIY